MNPMRRHLAIARLTRMRAQQWERTRSDPMENHLRVRAQSLLAGITYRDGSTNPGPLCSAHARDVIAWATARIV